MLIKLSDFFFCFIGGSNGCFSQYIPHLPLKNIFVICHQDMMESCRWTGKEKTFTLYSLSLPSTPDTYVHSHTHTQACIQVHIKNIQSWHEYFFAVLLAPVPARRKDSNIGIIVVSFLHFFDVFVYLQLSVNIDTSVSQRHLHVGCRGKEVLGKLKFYVFLLWAEGACLPELVFVSKCKVSCAHYPHSFCMLSCSPRYITLFF